MPKIKSKMNKHYYTSNLSFAIHKSGAIFVILGDYHPSDYLSVKLWYLPLLSVDAKILNPNFKVKIIRNKFYLKTGTMEYDDYNKLVKKYFPKYKRLFGEIILVPESEFVKIYHPHERLKSIFKTNSRLKYLLKSLLNKLNLNMEDVGISGSAFFTINYDLLGDIDLVVYGKSKSKMASKKVNKIILDSNKTFVMDKKVYHTRFYYKDAWICMNYVNSYSDNIIINNNIKFEKIGNSKNIEAEVTDIDESITYPPIYRLSNGKYLLSYRLGHFDLFKIGQTLKFSNIPIYKLLNIKTHKTIQAYIIAERQWIKFE